MKRTLASFLLGLFMYPVFAQAPSEAFMAYMNDMQRLIQEDLYTRISMVMYDTEEIPDQETFIEFSKGVEKDLQAIRFNFKDRLSAEENDQGNKFTQTMMLQLGELYLDRAESLKVQERTDFFKRFLSELGYDLEIENLTEDNSRAIIMGIHSALKVPFGLPNPQVMAYIYSEEDPIKELYLAAFIMNEMAMLNEGYDALFAMKEGFKKDYPDSRFNQNMELMLVSLEKLREGALVQDFSFVDLEGNTRSLSEFKDKVIYLDLWASWCGPCINTFKTKTPDFEKKLRGHEDIVLMYISVDEKQEPWRNYLDKNPMRGVHLFAGEGFEAPIMRYFKVWGIPRYLIIGKDNKLVSPNAPRPGDDAFKVLVEAASL